MKRILILFLIAIILPNIAFAAGSVSITGVTIPSSVTTGDSFTITMSVSGTEVTGMQCSLTLPGGSVLSCTGGTQSCDSGSASWSCTANVAGDYSNQITASISASYSGQTLSDTQQTGLQVLSPASLTSSSTINSSSITTNGAALFTVGVNNAGGASTTYNISLSYNSSVISVSPTSVSTTSIDGSALNNHAFTTSPVAAGTSTITATISGNGQTLNASQSLTVNKSTPSLVITGPTGWAVTSPTSATVLCTATPSNSEVKAFLYRNGTNVSSTTETVSSTTAITYNYTCNSSATANYTAGNATSQLLTLNAASSTSGSGSTGSSSTSSAVSIKLGVGKVNITSTTLTTGGKLIATIAKYQDVAIRGINITVVNSVANIKIIITKLSVLPSTVSFDISGKVYHYINIDKINITDSDINKVNLTFAVNKTWLTTNIVDTSNITLYRWANSKWNDLVAIKVSEDTSEVFYTASSPGLSVFVIGAKGVQAETPTPTTCTENWSCADWSACAGNVSTRTCTDSNACGTTTSKPSDSEQCQAEPPVVAPPSTPFPLLSYVIVIVVAIVVCVLIFLERNKITSYFQKSSKKKIQFVYKKPS